MNKTKWFLCLVWTVFCVVIACAFGWQATMFIAVGVWLLYIICVLLGLNYEAVEGQDTPEEADNDTA